MQKLLSRSLLLAALTASSLAVSDDHLKDSTKYKNGEARANCVYGQLGQIPVEVQKKDKYGRPETDQFGAPIMDTEYQPCSVAWEGSGLYQTVLDPDRGSNLVVGDTRDVWDLQVAYNCCVTVYETRGAFCHDGPGNIPWKVCSDYLDDLYHMGDKAEVAVLEGCKKAIEEQGKTSDVSLNDWLDTCKRDDVIPLAIPHTFDYLRDHTSCLWNEPYEDFCPGSRRQVEKHRPENILWNHTDSAKP